MTREELQSRLIAAVATLSGVPADGLRLDQPLERYGLGSMEAVQLSGEVSEWLGRPVDPTVVYTWPSIALLAEHLGEDAPEPEPVRAVTANEGAIAIIGLACRFPGADSPDALWRALLAGQDAVTEVPPERWDWREVYSPEPWPGRTVSRWGGFLRGIDEFDPFFFDMTPVEAERTDPQQRLLLELAWEALDDAGALTGALAGSDTGVFVGMCGNEYAQLQGADPKGIDGYGVTGNALSIAASRISYVLDLRGPSLVIDTACSSSLVAVHEACRALRSGECGLALAGGVSVILSPAGAISLSQAGALSPDGRCYAFDDRANGYVRSEGAALVVLKPLLAAQADGDRIYAVIRGTAVNQDGRTQGLTAPNPGAQTAVIRRALADAGVAPGEIVYVEAHGTGTRLGDPIEARGLSEARDGAPGERPWLVGSIKSNLGHMEAAAGVGGLLKVALSLYKGLIPGMANYRRPNPLLDLGALGLEIVGEARPWPEGPRLAGLSSFGFGGVNAHAVVQEAPDAPEPARVRSGTLVLPLSARCGAALKALAGAWVEALTGAEHQATVDLCATAARRRLALPRRLAVTGRDAAELVAGLRAFLADQPHPGLHVGQALQAPPRALLEADPGVAAQRWASGELVDFSAIYPGYRVVSTPRYPWQRRSWRFPGPVQRPSDLWRRAAPGAELHPILKHRAELAAFSGAKVASGRLGEELGWLSDHRLEGRALLPAAGAAELMLAAIREGEGPLFLQDLELRAPMWVGATGVEVQVSARSEGGSARLELYGRPPGGSWTLFGTATTGAATPADERLDLEALKARCPTAIAPEGVYRGLTTRGLEHGPLLRGLVGCWRGRGEVLASVRVHRELASELELYALHPALGDLALQALGALSEGEDRLLLPAGAARIERLGPSSPTGWVHATLGSDEGGPRADLRYADAEGRVYARILGVRLRPSARAASGARSWLYLPAWRTSSAPAPAPGGGDWLLVPDRLGVAEALAAALEGAGQRVERWRPGEGDLASRLGSRRWRGVVYLGALGVDDGSARAVREALGLLGPLSRSVVPALWLVTRGAQALTSGESADPVGAALWGLGRTVGFELAGLRAPRVDLDPADPNPARTLLPELLAAPGEEQIAWRGGRRLVERLVPADPPAAQPLWIHEDASYLITGGYGALGLAMARRLVRRGARHIALLGRRRPGKRAREAIDELRRLGVNVLPLVADVSDHAALSTALAELDASLPPLRGVVHAAGALDDAPLTELDGARLNAVLAPKLRGGALLDQATRAKKLDWFVFYSSAVGLLGAPGQGAYAAANAALGALARSRRAAGLPALAIHWGPWAEVGMAAETAAAHEGRGREAPQLVKAFALDAGLDLAERLMGTDLAEIVALPFDLADLLELFPATASRETFSELRAPALPQKKGYKRPDLGKPYVAPRTELEIRIAELWRQVLNMDRVGVHDTFFELGGDSVLATSVVSLAHRSFGVTLDLEEAFEDFTVEMLASHVEAALMARLDGLSDAEVEAMLAQEKS